MYKIILITLVTIFISSFSKAEIVKKIEIFGNKRISSETIKIYGNIEKNKNYSDKDLNLILNELYNTNFFSDVKVELKNNVLKINLVEYPTINQLIILGEQKKSFVEEIEKIIFLKKNGSFIKNRLSQDITSGTIL